MRALRDHVKKVHGASASTAGSRAPAIKTLSFKKKRSAQTSASKVLLTEARSRTRHAVRPAFAVKGSFCGKCLFNCKSAGGLSLHMTKMHSKPSTMTACLLCIKTFVTPKGLSTHVRKEHGTTCEPCGLEFASAVDYLNHIKRYKVRHLRHTPHTKKSLQIPSKAKRSGGPPLAVCRSKPPAVKVKLEATARAGMRPPSTSASKIQLIRFHWTEIYLTSWATLLSLIQFQLL